MKSRHEGYLLDTNILSDLVRNPQGKVFQKILEVGESQICTSIVVAGELWFGVEKKGSALLREQLRLILSAIDILPMDRPTDEIYGKIRADLQRQGTIIGPNDLLIAAHALESKRVLVTANEKEFRRVEELLVENWLLE